MHNWRIFRLPGSREVWHVDSGPATQVYNVLGFQGFGYWKSVDIGGNNVPRAWIEISGRYHLHIVNRIANFDDQNVSPRDYCREVTKCAAV